MSGGQVFITSGPTSYIQTMFTFILDKFELVPEFPLPPSPRLLFWLYSSRIDRPSMSVLLRFSNASLASSVLSNSTKAKLKRRRRKKVSSGKRLTPGQMIPESTFLHVAQLTHAAPTRRMSSIVSVHWLCFSCESVHNHGKD